MSKMIGFSEATPLSRLPDTVDGVEWTGWRVGIMRYQDRAVANNCALTVQRDHGNSTYWATINDDAIKNRSGRTLRFRTKATAMQAAVRVARAKL